jgi:hypothetical protein
MLNGEISGNGWMICKPGINESALSVERAFGSFPIRSKPVGWTASLRGIAARNVDAKE